MPVSTAVRPLPLAQLRDRAFSPAATDAPPSRTNQVRVALRKAAELGAATTSDLTPAFLDRFAAALDASGLSPSTCQGYTLGLRKACAEAVRSGHLAASPFDSRPDLVERSRPSGRGPTRQRSRFRSPSEFRALMEKFGALAADSFVNHRAFACGSVVAEAGLYHLDAARLRVADVDFEAELIRVRHRAGRLGRSPVAVPMSAELARVLRGWLRRRSEPVGTRYKLDERKVAEATELVKQGQSHAEAARRLGVTRQCVRAAVTRRNWKGAGARRRVADSEWLFPQVARGSVRPWTATNHGWEAFRAAAKAVGVKDVSISDLRYIHKHHVVSAVVTTRPDRAAPTAELSPVVLGGPRDAAIVLGERVVLTLAEYEVLTALNRARPGGLSAPELDGKSGHPHSRTILRRLMQKCPAFKEVIHFPGGRDQGGIRIGYREG